MQINYKDSRKANKTLVSPCVMILLGLVGMNIIGKRSKMFYLLKFKITKSIIQQVFGVVLINEN
jgi:hypothetical protein